MEPLVRELLLGDSEPMCRLRTTIVKIAPAAMPVLIEGPTGSGKELVAQALHLVSGRKGQFVPFNVCAIADTMFEDALFGHVRGAFTGAVNDSAGYLRQAHEGTAFLDEISGLALASQAKLLRALETGHFRPVGAHKDTSSHFRTVAATNQPLHVLTAAGAFRPDLLHRFGKMVLRIPALKERREDIPVLVRHFLDLFCGEGRRSLTAEAAQRLQAYDWPGNVRELRSVVETAVALTGDAPISGPQVEALICDAGNRPAAVAAPRELRETMETLRETEGDAALAAERLGVHRSTVYRRMQRAQAEGLYLG